MIPYLRYRGPQARENLHRRRVICTLVAAGKKVGVSAFSHKAIRKVLEEVQIAAIDLDMEVRCVQKVSEDSATKICPALQRPPTTKRLSPHSNQARPRSSPEQYGCGPGPNISMPWMCCLLMRLDRWLSQT